MIVWYAMLAAPILALVDEAVALSMTGWACRGQHGVALQLLHVPFAVAIAAATLLAWLHRRETAAARATSETTARRHFLAGMALGIAALSLAVVAAMWIPTWMLSSCLR